MKLHFDAKLVQRLLEHSKAAPGHSPTLDQLFDGQFRKDGRDVGIDEAWPTAADIDPAKLHPGLFLVGDQGIYLMTNGKPGLLEGSDTSRNLVAYAVEADPTLPFDTWWNVKRTAFGGDDGVIYLDVAFAEALLGMQRHDRVCIDLTPARARVAAPATQLSPGRRRSRTNRNGLPAHAKQDSS